jgi:hypothetical protein
VKDGSADYRIDVRAPPEVGKYHVILICPTYEGGALRKIPFSITEIVVK